MGASTYGNNVQAALEGELLVIHGDNLANRITIARATNGDVLVTGRQGTTVNGLPSLRLRLPTINSVEMLMNGGDDDVVINGMQIANDLSVNLGEGNDALRSGTLATTIGGNLSVVGEAGNETVRLANWSVAGDAMIDGQVGSLNSQVSGFTVGFALTVVGDELRDIVTISETTTGDYFYIETKGGNDSVSLSMISGLGALISTDMGADVVSLTDVSAQEDIGVFAGTENDRVSFENVASAKNITVSLDAGTDSFTGTTVFAELDAVFEGGFGTDTYVDNGILGLVKTDVKEFEIFP
jgi:hypothetical protein